MQKERLVKLGFAEKRLDAMMGDSGDQVHHLMQSLDEGGISEAPRYILRDSVRLGERQAGLGIFCCPCWAAAKALDLWLVVKDYAWQRQQQTEAEAAAAAAANPPAQNQMAAPAAAAAPPAQNQAEVIQMFARIWEAVRPGHAHQQ